MDSEAACPALVPMSSLPAEGFQLGLQIENSLKASWKEAEAEDGLE